MAETAFLFRFTCPHCGRILKAPQSWAGHLGACPSCQKTVTFPATTPEPAKSWTLQQVLLVLADDDVAINNGAFDQAGMLLAQGTCAEYAMVRELLPAGKLSVRQWRRILTLAGTRELLRLQLLTRLDDALLDEKDFDENSDPADPAFALLPDHAQDISIGAWQIMTRYLHYSRHGTCALCKHNPTGLHCVYQTFETFVAATGWDGDRQAKWERVCRQSLGLGSAKTIPIATVP